MTRGSTINGLPDKPSIDVSATCYEEIRKKLLALGDFPPIVETSLAHTIDVGAFIIRCGYVGRFRGRESKKQ